MAEKKPWRQKFLASLDERGLRSEADLTRLTRFIHFWILLGRSFVRNRCPIRASALSYTTLLALIPMLAVAISVTSSLLKDEGEERIYAFVDKLVAAVIPPTTGGTNSPAAPNLAAVAAALTATNAGSAVAPANFQDGTNGVIAAAITNSAAMIGGGDRVVTAQIGVTKKIHEYIANIRSGALGTVGIIMLLVVGIRMLGSVESTFNDIWGVTRGRNWVSRIQIYCTTILLGPLLLAGAAALAGGAHLRSTRVLITEMPLIGSLIFPALTVVLLWLTFALFYQLVPNTKVQFSASLIGGIVAGSLWHLNNLCGFLFASRVATNTTIYGSLALVPVFMIGLYLSWFIMLFGAQVSYAFQNRTLYLQEKIAENVNQRGREFVALRLLTCIGQRFQHGLPPATIQEMSAELAIPSRLVQQVLQTLITAHLVAEIHGVEAAYTPARPLEHINAHHILQAMRATNGQELVTRDEPIRAEVYGEFARIQAAEKQAAAAVTMLALVSRAQARSELAAPSAAGDELPMKTALVPAGEPSAPPAREKMESVHSPARPSPVPLAVAGENLWQGTGGMPGPENPPEATVRPAIPESLGQVQAAHPVAQPAAEEERDFPL